MKRLKNELSLNDIARNNIRYYRITKGLTQEKISETLEINEKSYSNLESGRYKISLERLDEISKILELEPYILLKEQHSADEVPNRLDFYKSQLKNKK